MSHKLPEDPRALLKEACDALERLLQEETSSALAQERANYLRLRERHFTLERRVESAEERCEELRADIEPLQERLRQTELVLNAKRGELETARHEIASLRMQLGVNPVFGEPAPASGQAACYCGKPVDTTNPDCVEYGLCEEHAEDA